MNISSSHFLKLLLKIFLFFLVLYFVGGVWFTASLSKDPNLIVKNCPLNNGDKEPDFDKCVSPQEKTPGEKVKQTFYEVTLWLPMMIIAGRG